MPAGADAVLLVERGLDHPGPIALTGQLCVLGKSDSADILIGNPFVSRTHCRISFSHGDYTLEDLGSKNGTFLNGVQTQPGKPVRLADGDRVALAEDEVVLVFRATNDTMTLRRRDGTRAQGPCGSTRRRARFASWARRWTPLAQGVRRPGAALPPPR